MKVLALNLAEQTGDEKSRRAKKIVTSFLLGIIKETIILRAAFKISTIIFKVSFK